MTKNSYFSYKIILRNLQIDFSIKMEVVKTPNANSTEGVFILLRVTFSTAHAYGIKNFKRIKNHEN